MKKIRAIKNVVLSFAVVLGIWQFVYIRSSFNKALFPSPFQAWTAFLELMMDGTMLLGIRMSMYRFAVGYLSAVLVAVLLGLLLGWYTNVFQYINPVVQLLRPISPMAWMPFIVLWCGIGDVPAIVVIFIAAFFPVLLSTVSAVKGIDPIYLKVSQSFGIKQPQILWKVIFPAAFPQIANGIHLALGTAWVFLVAGEMIGAQSGLGYQIIDARNNLRADMLLATIAVIGLIGVCLDALLKLLEKSLLRAWGGGR